MCSFGEDPPPPPPPPPPPFKYHELGVRQWEIGLKAEAKAKKGAFSLIQKKQEPRLGVSGNHNEIFHTMQGACHQLLTGCLHPFLLEAHQVRVGLPSTCSPHSTPSHTVTRSVSAESGMAATEVGPSYYSVL